MKFFVARGVAQRFVPFHLFHVRDGRANEKPITNREGENVSRASEVFIVAGLRATVFDPTVEMVFGFTAFQVGNGDVSERSEHLLAKTVGSLSRRFAELGERPFVSFDQFFQPDVRQLRLLGFKPSLCEQSLCRRKVFGLERFPFWGLAVAAEV
ncbi:hypothetical protein [Chthoniobacter sp.]|uniref:hypothetical protein n=1 Tax=Chthoniobacter sp. TaxID=2510640 RepID=UPI0032AEFBA7